MADRLYTIERDPQEENTFVIFDFEAREVRRTGDDPHPEAGTRSIYPPFFVGEETFWGIVGRIQELDEMNQQRARQS